MASLLSTSSDKLIRESYLQFLSERIHTAHAFRNWAAVSLTLKQYRRRDDSTVQRLSANEVSKCIKQLLKAVNRSVYKAANRRYGKKLMNITVVEGDGKTQHLHVHLLLEIPQHLTENSAKFFAIVSREWRRLRWANRQQDMQPIRSLANVSGWIAYILKDSAFDRGVIDLDNTNI